MFGAGLQFGAEALGAADALVSGFALTSDEVLGRWVIVERR
ncbi:MAG: hypothetical protein ACP5E5_08420 [Acidobacteriaceae bacterium]